MNAAEWSRYAAQLVQVQDFTMFSTEFQQKIRHELVKATSVDTIEDPDVKLIVEVALVPKVELPA